MTRPRALRFESYGVRVAVTSHDAAVLEAAAACLPPLRTPLRPGARGRAHRAFRLSSAILSDGKTVFRLDAAGRTICTAPSLPRLLAALEWEVNLLLAERARDRIFVHAGAVEWHGKALLVPGRSFSGKSTLVAALVQAGCGYLSDEYAVLDSRGVCHAYPRRLSLRVGRKVETRTAEELGGRTWRRPLPVGLVIVTRYRRDATWQPSRLSPAAAMMALLENTVAARTRSREALAALESATKGADAVTSVRGEAAEVVQALLRPS